MGMRHVTSNKTDVPGALHHVVKGRVIIHFSHPSISTFFSPAVLQ